MTRGGKYRVNRTLYKNWYNLDMHKELLDVLDSNGNLTGSTEDIHEVHVKGIWHGAVHVWFVDFNKYLILLQHRTAERRLFPSKWDSSVGGHITAGLTSIEAAIKETEEELGVKLDATDFKHLCRLKVELPKQPNSILYEKEFDDVYIVNYSSENKLEIDKNEMDAVKWFSFNEFRDMACNSEKLVPHKDEYEQLFVFLESIQNFDS
jgi:isopentenyl-diphosphate delta-isomerase